jgi:hypothetical protein
MIACRLNVKKLTDFYAGIPVGGWRLPDTIRSGGEESDYLSYSPPQGCLSAKLSELHMLKLHPAVLVKNGKKEFVVLPYKEFLAMQERLADAEDLLELRKAKRSEGRKPSIPLAEVKRDLKL